MRVLERMAAVDPALESRRRTERRRQPRYQVVLWDDDDHTYFYVIEMMQKLFGLDREAAFRVAQRVDDTGRAICLTTTREHAEFKRAQIHAFGRDRHVQGCHGSMLSTIEPVDE